MKLKLSLRSGAESDDILVTADATATVGQLAERLRTSHPRVRAGVSPGPDLCLRVNAGEHNERSIAGHQTLAEAGIRNGDSITLTAAPPGQAARSDVAATIRVVSGPDAGRSIEIRSGTTLIGRDRDCDVRLTDPMVSKRHAKLIVSDAVEIVDDNSANGVQLNDENVQRALVPVGARVQLGDTEIEVIVHAASGARVADGGSTIEFNRSPRLDPHFDGLKLKAPEPPDRLTPPRFQIATLAAPLLMGLVLFVVTRNVLSVLFIALSPFMTIGMYIENRRQTKRAIEQMRTDYRSALRDLAVQLQYACEVERTERRRENPGVDEIVGSAKSLSPLLWTRRPEHAAFGQVRYGLGTQVSRTSVEMPERNNTLPELWKELHEVVGQFARIERVPVVADLRTCGNIGVGGPTERAHPTAAAVVAQFVGLHSPAELVLCAITTANSVRRWEWLKWLPHTASEHSPIPNQHLVSSEHQTAALLAELEELISVRSPERPSEQLAPLPTVLVVVEDDAALDRARLVQIAESGPAAGVHLLWNAPSQERLPAACRSFAVVDGVAEAGRAGFVPSGEYVGDLELEPLAAPEVRLFASVLSPVIDAGALVEDQSDLPRAVSFLSLSSPGFAESTEEIIEQWRGHNSVPQPGAPRLKRDNTLRALVGQAAADRYYLDLRANGPHALVGGTTGAGKSEFLQSWILGMAVAHSSARVNFLFVDYKGGAAFADCVDLPHCVGLVTDLSPHLVRRALLSLRAELTRREHILNRKRAKDLLELERRRDPETPPSLVIIVDEFAALVGEVPEFVDGVVDVAQRGRSLGLHLVLATQRPAGVIKDNLRANTNLRVALRMADEDDSTDVVGDPVAGTFDPAIPGRGIAKTGPGRLVAFQSAYVGGHTTNEPPVPTIDIHELPFGVASTWDSPTGDDERPAPEGPADIRRIVANVVAADTQLSLARPVRPWLPDLPTAFQLEELPSPRSDAHLIYGVVDRPREQSQPVIGFRPDDEGHMAVYGTGGSGKSGFLRTIAIAAGVATARGGPCHVYGLDFGARQLAMLDQMPHVGAIINGDDQERTARLLRSLRKTVDERAERYGAVNASTIVEYRKNADRPDEPRILLLLDNFTAFRNLYELGRAGNPFDVLESIIADGRSVGVHLVVTADKSNALTAGYRSAIQRELVLRMTTEADLLMLGVKPDVFSDSTPAGRGFVDGDEVQVAIIKGDPNVANQAREVGRLARAFVRQGVAAAPDVERLAEVISFASIAQQPGEPVLGVWDETLAALAFDPSGLFLVSGPPRSGKTTTTVSMLLSLDAAGLSGPRVLFSPSRSDLVGSRDWSHTASDPLEIASLAESLTERLRAEDPTMSGFVLVIQGVADIVNGPADDAVGNLLRAIRTSGAFAIIEGEPIEFNGSYGLIGVIKLDRTGIVLQPDQSHGDTILGTDFPRVSRTEFAAGRGLHARSGRIFRVQVLDSTRHG